MSKTNDPTDGERGMLARNVANWDQTSEQWLHEHGDPRGGLWGSWQIPETDLCLLGDVGGLDVLDLGCGSGGWSLWLAERGARVVGLDPSAEQLAQARRFQRQRAIEIPLVQAPAEDVPLADASFDLILSDYGACTWSEPRATISEVGRLLRAGGRFVVNTTSPLAHLCWDYERGFTSHLARDYFGLHVLDQPWGVTGYQLPYGEWIDVFRQNGLVVEALVELQPPSDAQSTYDWVPLEWARRWPSENVWVVEKRPV